MKNASQLREAVREVELQRVIQTLEDAAAEGETFAQVEGSAMKPHVRENLVTLGYDVGEPWYVDADGHEIEYYNVSFGDEKTEIIFEDEK